MQELFFEDAVFSDGYMWFFDNCIQAICKANIQEKKACIVRHLQDTRVFNVKWLFEWDNYYYMASKSGCRLLVYGEKENQFFWIEPQEKMKRKNSLVFSQNRQIWFFPKISSGETLVFDIDQQQYTHRNEFVEMSKQCFGMNEFPIAFPSFCDGVFCFSVNNSIIKYDFNRGTYHKRSILLDNDAVNSVVLDGEKVWATLKNSNDIVCVDEDEHFIKVQGKQSYSWMYVIENYILILPRYSNNIILIEKNHEFKLSVIEIGKKEFNCVTGRSRHVNCCKHGQYFYIFPYGEKRLIRIHQKDRTVQTIDLEFIDYFERRQEVIKKAIEGQEVFDEFSKEDLKYFVNIVLDRKDMGLANDTGERGEKIWKILNN